MADDEARRAEVVDELLGRVQRAPQPDLVADDGERLPARDRRAGVDERHVGALEHRQRLGRLGAQRPAERDEHVAGRRAALGADRRAAVHDDARARGGRQHGGGEREVRRLGDAVVGAGAGDDRASAGRRIGRHGARGVAQRLRDPGQLGRRLPLDAHRDEKRARLDGADLAGEQPGGRVARLVERERAAAARTRPDGLDDRPKPGVVAASQALGQPAAALRAHVPSQR